MLNIFKSKAKDVKNGPSVEQIILAEIRIGMKTTAELRRNRSHQSVTAALSHLETKGLIYKFNTVKVEGKRFTQWAAETDPTMVEVRKKQIEHDKYFTWVRLGQKKGYFERFGGLMPEQAEGLTEGYICPRTNVQCDDECCVSAEDCHIKAWDKIIKSGDNK